VTTLAWIALALGIGGFLAVAADLAVSGGQRMWIMNVVWPVTALWSGPAGVWAYHRYGRAKRGRDDGGGEQPFRVAVAKATSHCGSGCTLGDLAAEWLAFGVPWTLFGYELFGSWVYDFAFAYLFGIVFQYFTIAPMRGLSFGQGLIQAIKADTLSLIAWQIGMYGWMALARFVIFDHQLSRSTPVFWFMMQIAMWAGFATAYPVNWWLVRSGIKERM
jgi:hypothetical protein